MSAVQTFSFVKYDANPRGNLWVKDENKFGHKLMCKMGWRKGRGLGKNENGMIESLKIRNKLGYAGVGFSEKLDLGRASSQYSAVLDNLNKTFASLKSGSKETNCVKSLENRSQEFKNRINYQRFLKGKDLCRYSEKDIACIFALKETDTNLVRSCENDSQPIYNSQLTIKDYFEMKFKRKNEQKDLKLAENLHVEQEENLSLVKGEKRKKKSEKLMFAKKMKTSDVEYPNSTEISHSQSDLQFAEKKQELECQEKQKKRNKSIHITYSKSNEFTNGTECRSMVGVPEENKKTEPTKQSQELECQKKKKKRKKAIHIIYSESNEFINGTECRSMVGMPEQNKKTEPAKESQELECQKKKKKRKKAIHIIYSESSELINGTECSSMVGMPEKNKKTEPAKESQGLECQKIKKKRKKPIHIIYSESNELINGTECSSIIGMLKESKRKEPAKKKKKLLKSRFLTAKARSYKFPKSSKFDKMRLRYRKPDERIKMGSKIKNVFAKRPVLSKTRSCKFPKSSKSDTKKLKRQTQPERTKIDSKIKDFFAKHPVLSNTNLMDIPGYGNWGLDGSEKNVQVDKTSDISKKKMPACLYYPESPPYTSWGESQRQACSMKLYNNMLKKIFEHPVLSTSNLLEIRGYGNWGL